MRRFAFQVTDERNMVVPFTTEASSLADAWAKVVEAATKWSIGIKKIELEKNRRESGRSGFSE